MRMKKAKRVWARERIGEEKHKKRRVGAVLGGMTSNL